MDLAVPNDMDGSPVTDVFTDDSDPGQREVEIRAPLTQDEREQKLDENVQNRLEEIGYLE